MEAKDSSDSSSAASALAGSKDGLANDEGNLSDADGLAKEAAFLFQNRRFQECVDVLNQLLEKKKGDAKVRLIIFFMILRFCNLVHFWLERLEVL